MKGINQINSVKITIIVFTILMLVLSTFCSLMLHNSTLYNVVSSKLTYLVEISEEINPERLVVLEQKLLIEGAKDLVLIDKEEAISLMLSELAFLKTESDFENPFKDHISFHFSADQSLESIKENVERISKIDYVNGVFYNEILIDNVKKGMRLLGLMLFICTIFLALVNFTFIFNILKILMISKHKEIKTMQLVGARPSFIKLPFLNDITKISYVSALLHIIVITIILLFVRFNYPSFFSFIELKFIALSVILIAVVCVSVSRFFTNIILNKLLSKRLYEK